MLLRAPYRREQRGHHGRNTTHNVLYELLHGVVSSRVSVLSSLDVASRLAGNASEFSQVWKGGNLRVDDRAVRAEDVLDPELLVVVRLLERRGLVSAHEDLKIRHPVSLIREPRPVSALQPETHPAGPATPLQALGRLCRGELRTGRVQVTSRAQLVRGEGRDVSS